MARYIICANCDELVEYTPETRYEGGTSYLYFKCPKCGHEKRMNYKSYTGNGSLNK